METQAARITPVQLRLLIRWADTANDNRSFWRRLWYAAEAYETRTRVNIQAMCANIGEFNPAKD